ncbi:MAG: hypothetical protein HFG29_10340 [Eubacterium sp.]|nr:hypothetical protein [Eubacterium sp.]
MYDVFIQNGTEKIQINGQRTFNRIEGKTTDEENKIPSFTFEIYPNNQGFHKIQEFVTLVVVKDGEDTVFDGRVLIAIPSVDGQGVVKKTVTCEGILGFLNDSMAYPYRFKDVKKQIEMMIMFHNSQVGSGKRFELEDINLVAELENLEYTCEDTTWTVLTKESFTDYNVHLRYEGIRRENQPILLKISHPEKISNQDITLHVNASSITVTPNFENMCTRVVPLTKDGFSMDKVSISLNNYYVQNEEAVKKYGVITKVVKFENITKTTSLKKAAKQYLQNNEAKTISVTLTAYDLSEMGLTSEKFVIGSKYYIDCKELEYSASHRLTKITRDINNTWDTTLEFGSNSYSIKSLVAKNKNISYMEIEEGE